MVIVIKPIVLADMATIHIKSNTMKMSSREEWTGFTWGLRGLWTDWKLREKAASHCTVKNKKVFYNGN